MAARKTAVQKAIAFAEAQSKRPMAIHRDCQGMDTMMGLAELVSLVGNLDAPIAVMPVKYLGKVVNVLAKMETSGDQTKFLPVAMLISPEMTSYFEAPEGTYLGRGDGTPITPEDVARARANEKPVTEARPLSTGLYL